MKFTSILRNLIVEASRLEVLKDKFVKDPKKRGKNLSPEELEKENKKIPLDVFYELINTDPTSRLNNVDVFNATEDDLAKVKVGSYVTWLIGQYLNVPTERSPNEQGYQNELKQMRERFMEDLYKLPDEIRKFERFKGKLPVEKRNINNLTVAELEDLMAPYKLEKTKGTSEDKELAKSSYEYPGSEVVFRGKDWSVVKISDCGKLGKDAACFFGGYNLKASEGETNWCTSAPGLSYFENTYCPQGPLYVILPNSDTEYGKKTGLPANRYQFHFPSNQFKDKHDRELPSVVDALNGNMKELKPFFKKEFAKGLTKGSGKEMTINDFSHGALGKFIRLYGFEEIFNSLPDTLEDFTIQVPQGVKVDFKLPSTIGKFKNLKNLMLTNFLDEVPEEICQLKNLRFLTVARNENLRTLPACLAHLPNLQFVNIKGSPVGDNLPKDFYREGIRFLANNDYIDFSQVNPEED